MSTKCWTVGFIGSGEITKENADSLLDTWLPSEDIEIQALVPEHIPRTHKGLRIVAGLLDGPFDIPQAPCDDPATMLVRLVDAAKEGEDTFLVILGTEDETAVSLAEAALDAGIKVKDLCAALDDVEFAAEAAPEPSRRRGRARSVVSAEVTGPATLVTEGVTPQDVTAAQLLEQAIRTIIKEEIAMFPGVHSFVEMPEADKEVAKVKAYVTPEGEYRLATPRNRKKKDEEEVELTEAEAKDVNLV